MDLAREIDKQAAKIGKVQDVLIEVSIAGEAAKAGVAIENAAGLVREAAKLKHIAIKGLMTMPPFLDDPEEVRPYFKKLRELVGRHREGEYSRRLHEGAFHGHERGFRGCHRRRRDDGAGGDGDIRGKAFQVRRKK